MYIYITIICRYMTYVIKLAGNFLPTCLGHIVLLVCQQFLKTFGQAWPQSWHQKDETEWADDSKTQNVFSIMLCCIFYTLCKWIFESKTERCSAKKPKLWHSASVFFESLNPQPRKSWKIPRKSPENPGKSPGNPQETMENPPKNYHPLTTGGSHVRKKNPPPQGGQIRQAGRCHGHGASTTFYGWSSWYHGISR